MPTTQIVNRQIADGAITDAKVAAGANIATAKLALNGTVVLRDGSAAMTGNLNLGNNRVTNVGTPSAGTDAATKDYADTLFNQIPSLFRTKPSARAATTANVTLSNPGTATFDGVTLTNGQVLLVRAQSSAAENGLYTFNGSGSALTRIPSMDTWAEVPGALVTVEEGSTYADQIFLCTSDQGGTLGTTAVNWQSINAAGLTNSSFVDAEVPSGSINGTNTAFTLANTPVTGSVRVYLNGQRLRAGAGNDYTISGTTITLAAAPLSGEYVEVEYRR